MIRPSFFLVFFILLVTSIFPAQQETEKDLDLESGTKVLSIPASEVRLPLSSMYSSTNLTATPDSAYFDYVNSTTIILNIPLNLPHKALIKKLLVYYTDKDDSQEGYISVSMIRSDMLTGDMEWMAVLNSHNLASSVERRVVIDSSIENARIRNQVYCYYLTVTLGPGGPGVRFHGAKIVYK